MKISSGAKFPVGKKGFTLTELMAGMAAAAILALTAGAMLWYGYLGWTRASDAVEMQRDMQAAMDVLSRAVRTGTNMTFSTGLVFAVQFPDKPAASIFASGSNLVYDPNTGAGGDQITMVNGTLQRFNVSVLTNMATIVLALKFDRQTMSNQVVIARRN